MGFKCGIVGLPNVGKSTLFNALTSAAIAAENYPFCTIDPNVGIVDVPDPRLAQIVEIVSPAKTVPAQMEFVDIAGLVAGASKGEGLGNQFLSHIRETHALAHIVRCFEDDNVVHVDGRVDPQSDIETINTELMLADMETLERAIQRVTKRGRSGNKEALAQLAALQKVAKALGEGVPVRAMALAEDDAAQLRELNLLTAKPVLYIANTDESAPQHHELVQRVRAIAQGEHSACLAVCAEIEAELATLPSAEREEFLRELGMDEPGLHKIIRAGYELLSLQTFFTAGPKEVRAWTIPAGATARQAAGIIHTDFARGFIRAEVISFDDFVVHRGESGAKEAGKWRLEGKDYVVRDGDIIFFRFNV